MYEPAVSKQIPAYTHILISIHKISLYVRETQIYIKISKADLDTQENIMLVHKLKGKKNNYICKLR